MIVDHSLVGTPGYQAPEFLKGDQPQEGAQLLFFSSFHHLLF
jgi:hypothetical protein